ncbi:MAG: Na/Pi cotransporter family protein [Gammaproteobacteria bacterium]|nr:Na/Pi cotransporter family protein [Gammaproteobacteria bacterium]
MTTDLFQLLGGLGLFLVGMIVMTDGLQGLAGGFMNRALGRLAGGPWRGAATGTVTTAILQSSSATTVAAVGFVSAGLLTFTQALGVIFGANLGTTVTGWLVALLGLKLQIGNLLLPLILVGALVRLFGRGRLRHLGFALAGFGLVFVGIGELQDGMAAYQGIVTPAHFPPNDLSGRLQLILIGIAVTVVTQSSSAGVATALTAVHAGAISFEQAAAMVIGMDVGTTVTAALATLGGSVETRRTGYSHVVYNVLTGIGAFLLLTPYTALVESIAPASTRLDAELVLVGFHSLFNLLGVLLILPFAGAFGSLMCRLVPEPADPLVDRLDRQLLSTPGVALDNVALVLEQLTDTLLDSVAELVRGRQPAPGGLRQVARRLDTVHAFVDRIHLHPGQAGDWRRLTAAINLLDHLQRLHERCDEEPERGLRLQQTALLVGPSQRFLLALQATTTALRAHDRDRAASVSGDASAQMRDQAQGLRAGIMAEVAGGHVDVPGGTRGLESVRWLRRVSYHVGRVAHYTKGLGPVNDGLPGLPAQELSSPNA